MVCGKAASEAKGPARADLGRSDLGVGRARDDLLGVLVEAADEVRQQDLGVVEQPRGHRRVLAAQVVEVEDVAPLAALGHAGHLLLGQRVAQVLLEAVLVALRVCLQPCDRRHGRGVAVLPAPEAAQAASPAAALPKERPAKHPIHLSMCVWVEMKTPEAKKKK